MTNVAETYQQINSLIFSLREEAAPYAKRFLDFIATNPTYGYIEFSLPDGEPLPFESYVMEFGTEFIKNDLSGISYRGEIWDYDDCISVGFVMPFEYMSDPDTWEKEISERFAKESTDALEALKAVAPGLIDGREENVGIESTAYMQERNLLVFDLTSISGGWDKDLTYRGKTYRTYHSWFFKPATNEVFYIDASDMVVISHGLVPALTSEFFQ